MMIAVALIALVAPGTAQSGCAWTIYDAVRDPRVDPAKRSRIVELVPVPFDTIVAESDLIVDATVQRVGTVISDDGCELYTDSALLPNSVILGSVRSAAQPGPSLIVRQWGGETVVDGKRVVFIDAQLRPLESGHRVLLFLSGPNNVGRYQIVGDFVGAFEVSGGMVRALTPDAEAVHGRFKEMPLQEFLVEIHRRAPPVKRR